MPRKTKDIIEKNEINNKKAVIEKKISDKSSKSDSKATKKPIINKLTKTSKKASAKKSVSKDTNTSTAKKLNDDKISKATKKTATKKSGSKETNSKKTKTEKTVKKTIPNNVIEYYDLPYSYNETSVKLLAQTPNTLFVYWEISEKDKESFIKNFGVDFFESTLPILSVYNETKNYYFNIEINDFANSWYINVPDEDCKYSVKLNRVYKDKKISNVNDYIEIFSSNEIIIPNGHVLINKLQKQVEFVNLKTNTKFFKDIPNYEYEKIYTKTIKEFELNNPSSNFNSL